MRARRRWGLLLAGALVGCAGDDGGGAGTGFASTSDSGGPATTSSPSTSMGPTPGTATDGSTTQGSTDDAVDSTGVPSPCDHVPSADDPTVTTYAADLARALAAVQASQARIETAADELQTLLGLDPTASADDIVAALTSGFATFTAMVEMDWVEPRDCVDTLPAARAAATACDPEAAADAEAICRGVCVQPTADPNACTGGKPIPSGCGDPSFSGTCDGICLGACDQTNAPCPGLCQGTCTGNCGVTGPGGCEGWCDAQCTGVCESTPRACPGTCSGGCFVDPASPQCADPFQMYCNGATACEGTCLGVARVAPTTDYCSVASEAASVAELTCSDGVVITRWFWAPGVMGAEMAMFEASVAMVEAAFAQMLAARAELALSLAYVDRLRTENNVGNPLVDLFEGECALVPLTDARQALLDGYDAAAAAVTTVDTIEAGLPGA